ncbi:MAG TPA: LysE family transporter [Cyclobacteriaceae bacterium]|jgi:threonine/homoserine/homoserine lactone efflux protein|nr:LysE family transporter [Cyclobacteriaceae bacterium]
MYHLYVFFLGFFFSFIGSIPPGTLNVTILQLSLQGKVAIATRFAIAVAIIEYPYAWIGVQFEYWLTSSPLVVENFQLIAAVVMTALAIFNLWPSKESPTGFAKKFNDSGFRRGIALSILNPMAIPYWMGFTAYLKAQGWITLNTTGLLHSYVFGTSIGALALLLLLIQFAQRLAPFANGSRWVKVIPGLVLLGLGLYAFSKFLWG